VLVLDIDIGFGASAPGPPLGALSHG